METGLFSKGPGMESNSAVLDYFGLQDVLQEAVCFTTKDRSALRNEDFGMCGPRMPQAPGLASDH